MEKGSGVMENIAGKINPEPRTIIIREGSIETRGFMNLYEVLGFIDLQCNPQFMKQQIIQKAEKDKQQEASQPVG
jgi:hypothetical protein